MSGAPARETGGPGDVAPGALLGRASGDALASLLELPAPLVEALRRCPRTATGLEDVVRHRLGALPHEPDTAARRILHLDGDGLRRLSLCAGAVWHARAVLHLLDGAALRAFVAEVGEAPRAAALRWHDLAGAAALPADEPLAAAVARDGWRCLHAWCTAQPPSVARRVLLSLPAGIVPMHADASRGVRIVVALAGDGND